MRAFLLNTSLATLLLCSLLAHGQPAVQWQKCLGGTGADDALAIQQTSDGGFIIAGGTRSNDGDVSGNHGGGDAWVVKLDGDRTFQWQKCIGGSGFDALNSIEQTSDGGYIVAGETSSNDDDVSGNHGGGDVWVVKLDGSGVLQWQKCIGGSGFDTANSIQQTSDGGFIIAAQTNSNDGDVSGQHGGNNAWVVKLDGGGILQWQKCLGGSSSEWATSIQQTSDGSYIMSGWTDSNDGDVNGHHGGGDTWVVKLNGGGVLQWQKCLGGSGVEGSGTIRQTTDGGYIMAVGETNSNDGEASGNHGGGDAWVIKLDDEGTLQWQKSLGGSASDWGTSIQQTDDGGYILAGGTSSNDGDVSGYHGGDDVWVVKLNGGGILQWQKCLGGSEYDYAHSIQQIGASDYILVGYTGSNDGDVNGHHGSDDAWVVMLGPDEVGVAETSPVRFSIIPNPVSAFLPIAFNPQAHPSRITLLDAAGRVVMDQPVTITTSSIVLDVTGQATGLYLLQVILADGTRAVERVVKE